MPYNSLLEGLELQGDDLVYIKQDGHLPTSIGTFNKRLSKTHGKLYFKAYKFPSKISRVIRNKIQKLIKYAKIDDQLLHNIVAKSIMLFDNVTDIKTFDVILTPNPPSPLLDVILTEIGRRTDAEIISTGVMKMHWGEIKIANDKLNKLDPTVKANILRRLEHITSKDGWKLKSVYALDRQYLDIFMKFKDSEISKKLIGKRVLIVDDILTNGSTMVNMHRIVEDANADEAIGFVFMVSS